MEMAAKCVILCLSIGISVLPSVQSAQTASVMKKFGVNLDMVLKIAEMNRVEYGDTCQPQEIKLKEIVEKSLEALMKSDAIPTDQLESELDKFNEEMKTILRTVHKVCDVRKLLVCDESTNLCKCGPMSFSNRDFKFIRGLSGQFMWAEDDPDFATTEYSVNHCADNTNCVCANNIEETNICDHSTDIDYRQKCNCKSSLEIEIKNNYTAGYVPFFSI